SSDMLEAELAGGDGVPAAGDDHRAEPAERGCTAGPVGEGQQRMARAALAIALDRALVGDGVALRADQLLRLARAGAERMEDRAVGLLRRVGEMAVEAVHQDHGSPLDERERLAPESEREPEREVGGQQWVRPLAW